uniref:GCN5-like N-acetyltransferase n=1 Tax=Pseudoerythrocladia kornmannii TaxID=753682 RepID=UPI001BF16539|nr:GCN5-like N-acetyltransferase [Pseudoerythrocladia kornmannii]QUE28366.1 Ycf52 [Pseudoerythrocladia kornmannii]UNJ16670.1 GCN5-like N-acetyltransferase [Pseudoerythrocladia kornmannii]
MTLWTLFFKNSNILSEENSTQKKDILLIKDIKYKNKLVEVYLSTNKNINLSDLEKLCDSVGWLRRPIKKVKTAIQNSFLIVSLIQKIDGKACLIGFARATSDYAFNATIWDVVVHPDFQGQGLGKILVHEIIKELRSYEINTITLFADPEVVVFYNNLGFVSDPNGIKGMFWYPK